jgi:pyridoxine/pyridoxamine 5'-phosphate oxidase
MAHTDAPEGWWREFVSSAPARTGKLAIVRADGSPHVTPVWVDLDAGTLVFTTNLGSIKGRAIRRGRTR